MTSRGVPGGDHRDSGRRATRTAGWTPPASLDGLVSIPVRAAPLAASDVTGTDVGGHPVTVQTASAGVWTLLVFLGSHCDGCAPFWRAVTDPTSLGLEGCDTAIAVTHDLEREDLGAIEIALATTDHGPDPWAPGRVVMSSGAWRSYGVQGPPFFVLVDGETVVTEGVAWSIAQVSADVGRARRTAAR